MNRLLTPVLLLSLLSACASMSTSQPITVSPPTAKNEQWHIYASVKSGPVHDEITIFINDKAIASGTVSAADQRTDILGFYGNHVVDTTCILGKDVDNAGKHTCTVMVDGKELAKLKF